MDFFDDVFGVEEERTPDSPAFQALFVSEDHAMNTLRMLEEPLSLRSAARCLRKALQDCSLELFRQVLEHSAAGEAVEFEFLSYHSFLLGCLVTIQYKGFERVR